MHPVRGTAIVLMLLAIAIAGCGGAGGDATASPTAALPVIDLRYDGGTLRVEVAATPQDRALGLGGRDALAEGAGMLFDLDTNRVPGFWMKDMRFPIDMVWIREDKTIAGVAIDVQPQPGATDAELRRYSPEEPVRYVLEINAGASRSLGLEPGDRVAFELP